MRVVARRLMGFILTGKIIQQAERDKGNPIRTNGNTTSTIRRIFGRSTFTARWRFDQVSVGSIRGFEYGTQELRKGEN
jgi:hypothetical protein